MIRRLRYATPRCRRPTRQIPHPSRCAPGTGATVLNFNPPRWQCSLSTISLLESLPGMRQGPRQTQRGKQGRGQPVRVLHLVYTSIRRFIAALPLLSSGLAVVKTQGHVPGPRSTRLYVYSKIRHRPMIPWSFWAILVEYQRLTRFSAISISERA